MEQEKLEIKAKETTVTREVSIVVTKQGNYPKKAEHFLISCVYTVKEVISAREPSVRDGTDRGRYE